MRDRRPSRRRWLSLTLAATFVLVPVTLFAAQRKEKCRWPGSMWATSANLYLKNARGNPRPEESREHFQKALEVSFEGIQKDPDNSQHYARAGEAYVGLGDLASADSMLAQAEKRNPACQEEIKIVRENAWAAAFNAGVSHLRGDNADRALEQFKRANAIYQGRPEALLQIGALYSRKADDARLAGDAGAARADSFTQAAVAAYRKAVQVATRPDHQEIAAFNLAQILALNERYPEAAEAYRTYLKGKPDHVVAQTNLAITLLRWAESLADQTSPDAKARADEARAHAKEIYADLMARPDLTTEDLRQVGAGLMTLGEYASATRVFRQVLEARPYDHDALVNLANIFYLADQPDSLLPVAKKLVELYPNQTNHMAFLAHAYREKGETRQALAVIEERERMAVEVADLSVTFDEQANAVTVRGLLHNRKLAAGTPVEIRFELLDPQGQIVATEAVSQTAPEKDATVNFSVKVQASGKVAGFRYSIG